MSAAASSRWNALRNGSYKDLLPPKGKDPLIRPRIPLLALLMPFVSDTSAPCGLFLTAKKAHWPSEEAQAVDHDTREEATAGSRLWDKLLLSAGSVSKSITAKLKDDGYNSDSDEEGVDTHVLKVLRDYYAQKGQGTPVWLGGTGSHTRTHSMAGAAEQKDGERSYSNGAGMQSNTARPGKVSLKGIYEQAAERTSSQQHISPRRGLSHTASHTREQPDVYAPRRSEESARSIGSATNRAPSTMSAGERFREKMKNNRTISSQSQSQGDSLGLQPTRSNRGSLDVPRDSASMAHRLKRGGTSSSVNPNRF